MKKSKKKYRIKSKARFLIFMTIVLTIFISGAGNLIGLNNALSMEKTKFKEIEIHSGDTLWNIAAENKLDNQDIRSVVYEICDLNQISANKIQPGETLLIPVYYE